MKQALMGTTWQYLEVEVMDDYAPMMLDTQSVSEVRGFRLVHDDVPRVNRGVAWFNLSLIHI